MQAQNALPDRTITAAGTIRVMPTPSFYKVFAVYVKKAREIRGWTQETLEKKSGVKQSTISAIENAGGKEGRKVKRGLCVDQLDAILDAFDMDVRSLCKAMTATLEKIENEKIDRRLQLRDEHAKRAMEISERSKTPVRRSKSHTAEPPAKQPESPPGPPSRHTQKPPI